MTLHIKCLGGLTVVGDDGAPIPPITHRRRLALLALLAVAGERGIARDTLVLLLWPESRAERGRHSLNQALYALRHGLGVDDLVLGSADLRLNTARARTDVADLERALADEDAGRAASLYRGPLLDGFAIADLHELDEWVATERARLADRVALLVDRAAAGAAERGEHRAAVEWWHRLAAAQPADARAAIGLATAMAACDDRAGAFHALGEHLRAVRERPGAHPDPAALALHEELKAGRLTPTSVAAIDPTGMATRATPAPRAPRPLRRSVVGLAGVAAGLALATLLAVTRDPTPPPLDDNLLAVAPFRVLDSELATVWSEGMMDVLARNLDGAGPLRTVAPSVVLRHVSGHTDAESARALGRRTGAALVLYGALLPAGPDSVRATAFVVDVASGAALAEVGRRDVAGRMDRLTDSLALDVLQQLDHSRNFGSTPETAVPATRSMEALHAFLRGEQAYRRSRWDSARTHYDRAVRADSTFALAWRRLGNAQGWAVATDDSLAVAARLRAGALARGLRPRDSVLVLVDSLSAAAHDAPPDVEWALARRLLATAEHAVRRWPGDPEMWMLLGEARYHHALGPVLGVSEARMLDAFDRAIALDSSFAPAYVHSVELALNERGRAAALRYADAYVTHTPREAVPHGTLLARALLGARVAPTPAALDTIPRPVIAAARVILRRWPDPAETALALARVNEVRAAREGVPERTRRAVKVRLAELLALRGHLAEAAATLPDEEDAATGAELTLLGALPPARAESLFARRAAEGSEWTRVAPAWWGSRGDTAALARAAGLASAKARGGDRAAAYDSAAAFAYLYLARGDSAAARARFAALPDSLCRRCLADRLTRGRLALATGRPADALRDLGETPVLSTTALEPLLAYWRGVAAEQAGDRARALAAYRFVAEAWRHADPSLASYTRAARAGLARLGGRR